MKVLFITTKLEGGAFNFITTLGHQLASHNVESSVLYGYGQKGFKDSRAKNFNASKLTPSWVAIGNYFSHKLFGKEILNPGWLMKSRLCKQLAGADLVHLNIVHSFAWKYPWLIDSLLKSGKPVVWTMHDSWALTGRCASPGKCEGWRLGCNPCQNLRAYPSSKIDLASTTYREKIPFFRDFSNQPQVRIVSCAKWLSNFLIQSGFGNVQTINNGIDVDYYHDKRSESSEASFLFVSRYLDHRLKGDAKVLLQLCEELGRKLTVVGDLPPAELQDSGVNLLPFTPEKDQFKSLLLSHKTLIFLSEVDTYSLLALEALASGMQILGLESNNMNEVGKYPNVFVFKSSLDLIKNLHYDFPHSNYNFRELSQEFMTSEYLNLYRTLTGL